MKKLLLLLMLTTGITGTTYAQEKQNKAEQLFELPANYPNKRIWIDLGKGNKMQIEVVSMQDLRLFANMDSVIRVFLEDIAAFKDSLSDESTAKRIDYTTDSMGRKKIRIQQFASKGSTYLVQGRDAAILKLEQDTIHFIGTVNFISKYTLRRAFKNSRYYRVSFFLNNYADIAGYADGSINKKIATLQEHINDSWISTTGNREYLKAEPTITASNEKGNVAGQDFLNLRVSVDLQNYKRYFAPSFSLGAGVIINDNHFKRDVVLSWDPHFFFENDSNGKLKSLRNDFLTLTWGQGLIADNDARKESHLLFIMSLSYLVKREGDYFEKQSFRLGGGRLSLFSGKTKIEPVLYFNHFFKGVTPGLRWIQSF